MATPTTPDFAHAPAQPDKPRIREALLVFTTPDLVGDLGRILNFENLALLGGSADNPAEPFLPEDVDSVARALFALHTATDGPIRFAFTSGVDAAFAEACHKQALSRLAAIGCADQLSRPYGPTTAEELRRVYLSRDFIQSDTAPMKPTRVTPDLERDVPSREEAIAQFKELLQELRARVEIEGAEDEPYFPDTPRPGEPCTDQQYREAIAADVPQGFVRMGPGHFFARDKIREIRLTSGGERVEHEGEEWDGLDLVIETDHSTLDSVHLIGEDAIIAFLSL